MTEVRLDIPNEIIHKIKIFKAVNEFNNQQETIIYILKERLLEEDGLE